MPIAIRTASRQSSIARASSVRTDLSKQSAILGGQTSALAAIQSAQTNVGRAPIPQQQTASKLRMRAITVKRSSVGKISEPTGKSTSLPVVVNRLLASKPSNGLVGFAGGRRKTALASVLFDQSNPLSPFGSAPAKFRILEQYPGIWQQGSTAHSFALPGNSVDGFGAIVLRQEHIQKPVFSKIPQVESTAAIERSVRFAIDERAGQARKRYQSTIFNGRPDVFGSTALSVRTTPLDRKWNRVRSNSNASRAFLHSTGALRTAGRQGRLEGIRSINKWVNARVQYADDRQFRGVGDHWAKAEETLRSRKGDCEDYAIAKMQLLKAYGVAPADMFLVIAKDLVRRADHALLVVQHEGRMLVLDSETDLILDADQVQDYRPIMSYSSAGKWLHGYKARKNSRPIRTASLAVGR